MVNMRGGKQEIFELCKMEFCKIVKEKI